MSLLIDYRQTLEEHGIRECSVVLDRLKVYSPAKNSKKLLSKSKNFESVRSNVPWLPTKSSIQFDSDGAFAVLTAHRNSAMKRSGETIPTTGSFCEKLLLDYFILLFL